MTQVLKVIGVVHGMLVLIEHMDDITLEPDHLALKTQTIVNSIVSHDCQCFMQTVKAMNVYL